MLCLIWNTIKHAKQDNGYWYGLIGNKKLFKMGLLRIEPYYNLLALHVFHSMFKRFEIKKIKECKCQTQKKYVKWWIFQFVPSLKGLCLANIKFVITYVHYVVLTGHSFHTGKTCKIVPPQQWRLNWTDWRKRGGKKVKILKEWQKRDEGWRCESNDFP